MPNDSIETLLLRHYGSTAPAPAGLEERLLASVHHENVVIEVSQQQRTAEWLREQPMSRRRAVRFVALGTAGLGLLSVGMEGLQMLEAALVGQDTTQLATP